MNFSYSMLNDGVANMIPGLDQDYVSAQLLFTASWEIHVWGKYRRDVESDWLHHRAGLMAEGARLR
jgi:hypothetical protein